MFQRLLSVALVLSLANEAAANTLPAVHPTLGRIGQGYDHRSNAFRSPCIAGSFAYAGENSTSVAVEKTMTENQLSAVTHSSISGKVDLFVASAKLSASYYQSFQTHSSALTMSWGRVVNGKTVVLTEPVLTADGIKARDSGDPTLRHLLCGDGFLNQIDLGASVVLTATLYFANASYRDEFLAKVKYRTLGWKKVKELKRGRHWAHKFSHIDFSGYQIGGDPSQLDEVLAGSKKTTCTIADIEACYPAMQRLEAYAFGPEGLSKQLFDLRYSQTEAYAPLFYHFARYQDHGFGELESGNFPDLTARDEVLKNLEPYAAKTVALRKQANDLLASKRLLPNEHERVESALSDIDHNRSEIKNIRAVCISSPDRCRETYYGADIRDIDPDVLKIPERLRDYCLWSKGLDKGNGLTKLMGEITKQLPRECETIDSHAHIITNLNIRGLGVDTLAPLALLPNLEILDAGYNSIQSARPLLNLRALREVNIRNNILNSVTVFEQMSGPERPTLRTLNLAYNRVLDANPLAESGLDTIKLHGNPLSRTGAIEANRARFKVLTLNTRDICDHERYKLSKTGYDPKKIAKFAKVNFSPWYNVPHDPSSGIEGWYRCDHIAKDYQ